MIIFRLTQLALVAAGMAAWATPVSSQSSSTAGAAPRSPAFHGGHFSPPSRGFHAPPASSGSVGVGVPLRRQPGGSPHFGRHFGDSGFGTHFGGELKPHGAWRHRGHGRDHGVWIGYGGYWGDGDGYADTIPTPDQFGFFAQDSGVSFDGERPIYHYDRGYPYEWFDPAPELSAQAGPRHVAMSCRVELVPSGRGNLDVPVRVCRGS